LIGLPVLLPGAWGCTGCSTHAGDTIPPPEMVVITGGTFAMGDTFGEGSRDEKPVHSVTVSDFQLGRYEVTNEAFVAFLNARGNQQTDSTEWYETGSDYAEIERQGSTFRVNSDYADHPVLEVSWYGAVHYCNWLSEQHGYTPVYRISGATVTANWQANGYRLPTEAEWEYAARSGGKNEKWAGTSSKSELPRYANTFSDADGYWQTAPVGSLLANDLDLHDMSGNVWEWCWDWYGYDYYSHSPALDPRGPDSGLSRVYRGCSLASYARSCRISHRSGNAPAKRDAEVGFRLARSF
jgi:formylglycine-generating enzyme required for sulfatase activity